MIDIKKLVTDPSIYITELTKRNTNPQIALDLQTVYLNNTELQKELDSKRQIKNQFNQEVISLKGEQKQEAISKMRIISDEIAILEDNTNLLKKEIENLSYQIPNLTSKETPIGKNENDNVAIVTVGTKPSFEFQPKHYHELPIFKRDYLGIKGVEAFGARGYYIKGELAKLQKVMFQYVLEKLENSGFEYIIPPILVNEKVMYGTGFFPDGIEDTYQVTVSDKKYYLVGTSEAPLMYLHSNTTLDLTNPIMLMAQTPCFRKEAGSYGKDTQGGIRVHQFDKLETVVICKPEDASKMFNLITQVASTTIQDFGLCFNQLEICTGDISKKNHRQIDLEAWFPAQESFRELCSSSNCTDYQTRNLGIYYLNDQGKKTLSYSLNCTGVVNRFLYAILENYQQADGSIVLPKLLADRMNKKVII